MHMQLLKACKYAYMHAQNSEWEKRGYIHERQEEKKIQLQRGQTKADE